MGRRLALSVIVGFSLILLTQEAKTSDPYKVLGVERNASQREIQKAFHKLSLQYHPDKNKAKGAQEKFAKINNAYEILSDEEKRKNYDLYGDEKGNPGFDAGYPGDQGGYTYFTSGGQGQNGYNFRQSDWQNTGSHGSSRSFSFSFSGRSSGNSFGFDLGNIFNMFGGNQGRSQFSGFSGSTKSQSGSKSGPRSSPRSLKSISSQGFKKEVVDQGMTWLILSYTSSSKGIHDYESVIQEVAESLQGALKVGSINCESEISLCSELGVYPQKAPRLFIYSYKTNNKGSLVEYKGGLVAKNVRSFCQDHLPRFSKRIDLKNLESILAGGERLPRILLLSTKSDTPVIWRVISGLYRSRFTFIDAQVHDVSDPIVKKLGVDSLPAIVGWLSNGEKQVLKSGIAVKDLKSAIHELSALLDGFEKKNKKVASSQNWKGQSDSIDKVPMLTRSNFDTLCGEKNPVCIIAAFRSSKAKEKLEFLLSAVSQKSLTRRQSAAPGSSNAVSYALLDATKQSSFLNAFDKSGYKSSDKLLVAYKPRRGKFATFQGDMTVEEVERFISSVLSGDVQFSRTRQKPVVN